jgi:hypothetical protein
MFRYWSGSAQDLNPGAEDLEIQEQKLWEIVFIQSTALIRLARSFLLLVRLRSASVSLYFIFLSSQVM